MEIGAGETQNIGLRFAPTQAPGMVEILVFVNDEDDKNEETFCIRASYSWDSAGKSLRFNYPTIQQV